MDVKDGWNEYEAVIVFDIRADGWHGTGAIEDMITEGLSPKFVEQLNRNYRDRVTIREKEPK